MKYIRWVLVLPASIGAFVIISLFLKYIYPLLSNEEISERMADGFLYQSTIGIAAVIAFIFAGIKVAPSHKKTTLKVLSILLTLFIIGSLYIFWDYGWVIIGRNIVSLVTILFAYLYFSNNEI
jgi:hypothetical protein